MGYSGRLLADGDIIHVEEFDDYVEDLQRFVRQVVQPDSPTDLFVFGHSMGGGVVVGHLQKYGGTFDAVVLNAPMLEIHTGPIPEGIAYWLSTAATWIGRGERYAAGLTPPSREGWAMDHAATNCAARYERYRRDMWTHHRDLITGGPSYRWLSRSLQFSRQARTAVRAETVNEPVLLFQADQDDWVRPGGMETFCRHAPRCEILFFPGSKHVVWNETDPIRTSALTQAIGFFQAHRRSTP